MRDKVFERGENVARIFKVVDACNRCGLAFRIASERITNDPFRHFADELRQMLDRFSFELLTEIHRTDGGDFGPPRSYVDATNDADILRGRCESALQDMIGDYDESMVHHIPAHARAMIKRQGQLLKQMSGRFANLYRDASA